MMLSNRCSEGFLNRPFALGDTGGQSASIYTKSLCPLGHIHCLTIKGEKVIVPTIVGLFSLGGPLAVLRRVWTIVVNTLNRMFRTGPWSHVGIENGEVVPSWVHSDSAFAIIVIPMVVRVTTSLAQVCPDVIFRSICHSVLGDQSQHVLSAQAPTALSEAASETCAKYDRLASTVTLAKPCISHVFVPYAPDNNQASISVSNFIYQFRHCIISKMKAALGRCKMLSRSLRQGRRLSIFMIAPYKLRDNCILA